MVVDTSAVLAMLFDEPEADDFERLVEADPIRLVSCVTRVETRAGAVAAGAVL